MEDCLATFLPVAQRRYTAFHAGLNALGRTAY
jgi:hypothetical protein